MIFKEMDPEEALAAIAGHENVVKKAVEEMERYFSKLRCFRCSGSCRPTLNNQALYKDGEILPDYLAECNDCGVIFTPYTMIEVRGPTKDPLADD